MPFTPTNEVRHYVPSPAPRIEGGDKEYLQSELRKLRIVINQMVDAIEEIQEHLDTLP